MNQTSIYNPNGFTNEEIRTFGFIFLGVVLTNVLPYICVIWLFFKGEKFQNLVAYQIMGHFGINQMCLQFTYAMTAIMCILNQGFGDFFNKAVAVFNSSNWNASIYFIFLLALKRVDSLTGFLSYFIADVKTQDKLYKICLYSGHIMAFSWLIVYSIPEMGMKIELIYFVNEPQNTLYNLRKVQQYYAMTLIRLKTSNTNLMTKSERDFLIQSLLICAVKTCLLIYTYNYLSITSKFQYELIKCINTYEQGYAVYTYLIFNRTLRTEFLRLVKLKLQNKVNNTNTNEAKSDEGNKFEGEVRLWDQMSLAGVGPPLFKRGYLVIDEVAVNVFLYLRNGITFLRAIKFECIDPAFKQPVGTIVSFKFTETPYPSTSESKELDHIKEVYLRTDTSTVTTFSIILKSKLNEAARSSKNAIGSSQKASARSISKPVNRTILGSNLNMRRQNLGSVLPILGAQNNYAVIPPTKPNETCYIKSADGFDTDRIKSDQNKTLFKKVHEDHIDEIKIHQRERSKPPPKRSVLGVSSRTRNKTKKFFLNDYKAPVRSTSANKSLSDCEMWIDEKEDGELFSIEDISKAKSDSKIDQEIMDIDDEGSALNASLLTGLTNIGNTCYMNAVIQALRSLKIFRAACNQVKKLIKQNCHVIEASPEQLLPFYTKYEQLHSTPSSSELKECLDELRLTVMKEEKNEERLVMREQEDAHEFLVKFIDKIGTEMKQALEILDIQSEDPSYSSLTYKLIRKLACEKCKDNRPSDDEGNHFMLHFIGHQSEAPYMLSIASLFRNSLLAEMVSTRCPKCGHASALMTQEFAKLPKYLIFVVKRLVFEPETKSMKKITEPLVLNKFIAIKNCEPSTSSGDKTSPRDSTRRRSSEENAKRRTTRRRESIIHKSGKVGYVDVVVGEKDDVNERIYTPVDEEWRKKACQLLEIDYEPLDEVTNHYAIYNSTIESTDLKFLVDESPAVVGNVQGDGNCLFRCISHVITGGKEDHYRIVREKICDFMERYVKLFAPMQGISEEKFQAHIAEMRQDAEWGTTMELLAIATMFKVLVFTFIGGRWASYRPFFSYENPDAPEKLKLDSLDPNLKTIYLDNLCEAHFSPVICVPKKMLYQLICIVNHYGDTRGGHYTSDVWKNGTWNHCDDSRVKPKDEHEVMADSSENGYIFIYQIFDKNLPTLRRRSRLRLGD